MVKEQEFKLFLPRFFTISYLIDTSLSNPDGEFVLCR